MKRTLSAMVALALLLAICPGLAEAKLPTLTSLSQGRAVLREQAENFSTATAQYLSPAADAAAYLEALEEYGFVRNGLWRLRLGEGEPLLVMAYTWLGQDAPPPFAMEIDGKTVQCHVLLQMLPQGDGALLVAITRSVGVGTVALPLPVRPAPKRHLEVALESTWRTCPNLPFHNSYFDGGRTCPYCHGENRYEVKTTRDVWVNDPGSWVLTPSAETRKCPVLAHHSAVFGGGDCPFCGGSGAYQRVTQQWVWAPEK